MTKPSVPLQGIRVLDLGRLHAAPLAAQILGDLGADVIKIEHPQGGDTYRQYGPNYLLNEDGSRTTESSCFISTNRNKRSITVNLKTPRGQELVRSLAGKSDVLIENYKAGSLKRYGLDYASISAVNPELIYCSVTAFGQTGPYAARPGLDSVLQAMSGLMSVTGDPDGGPQKAGVPVVDVLTGVYSALAIMAALRDREFNKAGGKHIDMALLDNAMTLMASRTNDYLVSGIVSGRLGVHTLGSAPAGVFETADGAINIQAGDQPGFEKLCAILGIEEIIDDPRFVDRGTRFANSHILNPIVAAAMSKRGTWELNDLFSEQDIVSGPIFTVDQTLQDPHVKYRGILAQAAHPTAGDVSFIGSPIRFTEFDLPETRCPPTIGQHNQEILAEVFGLDCDECEELRRSNVI